MSQIILRADKIVGDKLSLVQPNHGTIRVHGSKRSPFLRDLKLKEGDSVKVIFKKLSSKKSSSGKKRKKSKR